MLPPRFLALICAALMALSACGDDASTDPSPPQTCESDADCGPCMACTHGQCQARSQGQDSCFNQIDDDCDGVVDNGCVETCRGVEQGCDGMRFFACDAGRETTSESCDAVAGGYCTDAGCASGCTPGESVCNGGVAGHPYQCSAEGALEQIDTCEAAEHCAEGSCVADLCVEGTTSCRGGTPVSCDANGVTETPLAPCQDGEVCVDGACVADTPVDPPAACAQISADIEAAMGASIRVSPAGPGQVTVDGATTTLRSVVSGASAGDTILLEDGEYTFAESDGDSYTGLYFTTPNLTLRSVSGDPASVVLDSAYADHGGESAPITVAASGITLSGFTVKRSIFHLIHVWSGGDDVHVHNVRLIDGGQQFLKVSPGGEDLVTGGHVTCSSFLMTPAGRRNIWGYGPAGGGTRCYTGGIDTHSTDSWTISDNTFEGIYCEATGGHPEHGKKRDGVEESTYVGGLAEHAIHMWDSSPGTRHVIERNQITNCARGIGLGLGSTHRVFDGLVRNNMITSEHAASSEHDVGIMIEGASGVRVLGNTVWLSSPDSYPNAIEYRFDATTDTDLFNNLTNRAITSRNGGQGVLKTNVTSARADWFVAPAAGDLHLSSCAQPEVSGAGTADAELLVDFDGDARGAEAPDVGADQCQ